MLKRKWINQPSTLQPLHNLHGTNVLAIREGENIYRVYFLSGHTISMLVPSKVLSFGWNLNSKDNQS